MLRTGRMGYLETTAQRLVRIDVQVKRTSDGTYATFDRYELGYTASPVTGNSLLTTVQRTGFDQASASRAWPALTLSYAAPRVGPEPLELVGHPGRALSDPDLALVDIDGDALPDLLDSSPAGWFLRRNLGDGRFAACSGDCCAPISTPRTASPS